MGDDGALPSSEGRRHSSRREGRAPGGRCPGNRCQAQRCRDTGASCRPWEALRAARAAPWEAQEERHPLCVLSVCAHPLCYGAELTGTMSSGYSDQLQTDLAVPLRQAAPQQGPQGQGHSWEASNVGWTSLTGRCLGRALWGQDSAGQAPTRVALARTPHSTRGAPPRQCGLLYQVPRRPTALVEGYPQPREGVWEVAAECERSHWWRPAHRGPQTSHPMALVGKPTGSVSCTVSEAGTQASTG